MLKTAKRLGEILSQADKRFLLYLLFASLFITLIETVGVSAIMPFMAVATDFSIIQTNEYYKFAFDYLQFENEVNFVIGFGIVLISFYILRSLINLTYLFFLYKFVHTRYHLIATRLFKNYLKSSYKDFTSRNSSTMTKAIINEAINLVEVIRSFLFIASEFSVLIAIYTVLIIVNWKITLFLTLILGLNALLMVKTISKTIRKAGVIRAEVQRKYYEVINRTFGNFKIVKLRTSENEAVSEFSENAHNFANAQRTSGVLTQTPRLFLEAVAFSIVVFIVTYLVAENNGDISSVLSTVTMFVLGLYRLMPSVNRITNSYNQIQFNLKSLDIVHSDLFANYENLGDEKISFQKNIVAKNIHFSYEKSKNVLKGIDLEIVKGDKVAFVGESGSGKSTFVDLLIGLYKQNRGEIFIDGVKLEDKNLKSWRKEIGYIPQSVYLFDGTVAENVAFSDEVDRERVDEVLKIAKIYDFLQTKEGQETFVGEGGIKLSGGQKQRIAIARALYLNPSILVLDEATSALDSETEALIMDEIYEIGKDKTLIIIAHRLSTIDRCEKIFTMDNGKLRKK
jgi:ABC-type multidrug transport system fused ATPase/permease subunit